MGLGLVAVTRAVFLAHLYPPYHNAGGEWMVHTLLRSLVERGHDAHVLLSRHHPEIECPYEIDGVRVSPLAGKDDAVRHAAEADVVAAHLENTPRAVALSRVYRKPLALVIHNTSPWTKTWLVDDAALVVFNSQWLHDDHGGHRNGIIVRPPVLAGDYRTIPGDRVTLINLNEAKGAGTFYKLAERMPDVRFLGVRGAYGDQDVRLLPNVEVLDHVPGHEMRERVYGRTRILLMPSSYESWGRTAVEAMCSGIPVIAHPTPGLRECLGHAGAFADRDDVDAWEAALRRLLEPAAWAKASEAALDRAAELDPAIDLARWCAAVEQIAAAP